MIHFTLQDGGASVHVRLDAIGAIEAPAHGQHFFRVLVHGVWLTVLGDKERWKQLIEQVDVADKPRGSTGD